MAVHLYRSSVRKGEGRLQSVETVDLSGLNPKQRDAVTLVGKSAVVFAGPGSGKTTVLTRRAAWLLSRGVPANRIMVVTFTRMAAQEMKQRLLKQTGSSTGMTIGTFHSVFLRLLRNSGVSIPRLAGEREQAGLIRELLIKSGRPADEEMISNTLSQIGYCKGNLILPERMKVKQEKKIAFRELFQEYQQVMEQRGIWDYDDILLRFHDLLRNNQPFQRRFVHILVDEFQDINRVQMETIRLLLPEGGCLFAVGDDDQSIYGFRGSDPGYMLDLPRTLPECTRIVLTINHRSTEPIIRIGQQLIAHNRFRQPKRVEGTGKVGAAPRWWEPEDEEDEAGKILDMLTDGVETAVLYRTSTQARAIIDALVRADIPFAVSPGDAAFYQRWQVADVLSYLKLANHPDDLDALVRVVNRPKRYLFGEEWLDGLQRISRERNFPLLQCLPQLKGLERYQTKYLERMVQQVTALKGCSPSAAVNRVRREIGYDSFLSAMAKDLGHDFQTLSEPVDELSIAAGAHGKIEDFLDHIEQVDRKVREQPPSPRVRLMTLHKSKGLEFDRVFLIGLHAMVLPHHRSLQVPDKMKSRAWEEERRLLYVGLTRARRELILSVSRTRQGKRVGPSPFLKEMGYTIQEEAPMVQPVSRSRPDPKQPQLRYVGESLTEGDTLLHSRWGEGAVIQVESLEGTAPGRKVTVRFGDEIHTLHYELSRQLGLLERGEGQ
ncbi:ATP-dependent helicase [Kroppenstedtia guangzhouensis]|uniref:ATP-dependent helicase n=1 Tax=Kroppenstedtia guangzhouensis TaxID=1274356 RepID=UPI0016685DE1|nr:ATP-dependent helicase [Kroppenstedtia guangzhouensis]